MLRIAHKQSNVIKGALTQFYQNLDTRRAFTQFETLLTYTFLKKWILIRFRQIKSYYDHFLKEGELSIFG